MKYFLIEFDRAVRAGDDRRLSSWDSIWTAEHESAPEALDGNHPLSPIWKSPPVKLLKGNRTPDFYSYELHFAISQKAKELLKPLVENEVEFLTLQGNGLDDVSVIHPLWPIPFDKHAIVSRNPISGNITQVEKYSFAIEAEAWDWPRNMFRMMQAEGSAAYKYGSVLNELVVSDHIRRVCAENSLSGVVFHEIHETR